MMTCGVEVLKDWIREPVWEIVPFQHPVDFEYICSVSGLLLGGTISSFFGRGKTRGTERLSRTIAYGIVSTELRPPTCASWPAEVSGFPRRAQEHSVYGMFLSTWVAHQVDKMRWWSCAVP
jgi:hypothetical protein